MWTNDGNLDNQDNRHLNAIADPIKANVLLHWSAHQPVKADNSPNYDDRQLIADKSLINFVIMYVHCYVYKVPVLVT